MIQFPQLNHICKFENTFFEAVNSKKLVNEDMHYAVLSKSTGEYF